MTVSIAQNKAELGSRMRVFFSPEFSGGVALDEIRDLLTVGEVFAFGGVLRDIALYGGSRFSSDVDLVYVGNKDYFLECIPERAIKNRFGGYRFKSEKWDIDIWHVEDTWAFKSHRVEYRNILSLLDTTITNWDAILYSLYDGRVICKPDYFTDLSSGYLDVVLEDNPNKLGAVVRVLRCFILKQAYQFSPKTIQFLADGLEGSSNKELIEQEKHSYPRSYLTESLCDYLRSNIHASKDGILPLTLDKFSTSFNVTKDMFNIRYQIG